MNRHRRDWRLFEQRFVRPAKCRGLYAEFRVRDAGGVAARLWEPRPPFAVTRGLNWRSTSPFASVRYMLRNVSEMTPTDVDLYAGHDALAEALTRKLERVTVRLGARFPDIAVLADDGPRVPESAHGLTQGWSCPDLLSGLYLQFYLMIFKNRRMRRCDNPVCGMPFLLTRKDKRFCNDSCRSNARHYSTEDR